MSEFWTISTEIKNNLETPEICAYRRIVRIPWMKRISYEEILNKIVTKNT